jgi:hypothetical protein
LKSLLNLGYELKVKWLPGHIKYSGDKPLSGEVIGRTIFIYDKDEPDALSTLKHEFLEYVLTNELVKPYKMMINRLISQFEEDNNARKEKLVEKLCAVL